MCNSRYHLETKEEYCGRTFKMENGQAFKLLVLKVNQHFYGGPTAGH